MSTTKIEWADMTINPVVGCSKCSLGCDNCYAERQAARLAHMPQTADKYAGVVDEYGKWTGKITVDLSVFDKLPRKSQRIFVGSMGDVFHRAVSFETARDIIFRIESCQQHTFILLTKRAERMWLFYKWLYSNGCISPKNLWLGVTVCNQQEADEKIPLLLQTPAAKRFVSIEPMLGPINLEIPECGTSGLNWVICGGETGPKARPMNPDWARGLRDQSAAAGVPFFFKGWGKCRAGRLLDGVEHNAFPEARP